MLAPLSSIHSKYYQHLDSLLIECMCRVWHTIHVSSRRNYLCPAEAMCGNVADRV